MGKVIFQTWFGPLHSDYTELWRWADQNEVKLWMAEHTHIPAGIGRGLQVYVTDPGSPKPGGTGNFRIEFCFPRRGLDKASKPEWHMILPGFENTPIYNVRITAP